MPCRHYESDDWGVSSSAPKLKAELDKMARIACAAMEELVRQGKADFLVLKNEEVRDWWEKHTEADRREKARVAEKERKERVKAEALARLTDEEKELLGLKKPAVKKHKKHEPREISYDIETWVKEEEYIEDMLEDLKENYLQITRGK